ncbi:MAG: SGNH/GDSL hydrolase family protein [Opitutaceae bacterium]|nr:SGNH/GDSL hydrolase family protein [Opitutaceae bacterium]
MKLRPFLALVLSVLCACLASGAPATPATLTELNPRDGLPVFLAKARAGAGNNAGNKAELRVAFLGGSITAANGWRIGTMEVIRNAFPGTRFTEIQAALPGTGSDFGAARLHENVLVHQPDLLFVEFAVNDLGKPAAQIERTMEGIVRQARLALPDLDIWFVYTLSSAGLPDMKAGRYPSSARAMENVASHYGIPSLQFGVEILRRLENGSLVFRGPSGDPKSFTGDNVHPTAAGHRIYTETVARSLPGLAAASAGATSTASAGGDASASRSLPAPLHTDNWTDARLVPAERILETVTGSTSVRLPQSDHRFAAIPENLRRPTWQITRPGDVLSFAFEGSAFGLASLKGPDAGSFRVTVDDRPPRDVTLFDSFCQPRRYRVRPWFYPETLSPGRHRVKIELLPAAPDKARILKKGDNTAALLAADPDYARNVLTLSDLLLAGRLIAP